MNITIRKEKKSDYKAVFTLIKQAFKSMDLGDNKEQFLVERLRNSSAFIPELSLIAEVEDEIVGHILLTKIKIINEQSESDSLVLAPVSVVPKFQRRGIGGLLIKHAHKIAKEMNFKSVILLGHADYYPKFGYVQAHKFGIELPFDAPKENCLAIELTKNGLEGISGTVEYPKEFF